MAKVINDCHATIVDEAPMTHRLAFEAIDRILRDITCKDCPMGGIPTLFCGDFRQLLPVIPRGKRANIMDAFAAKVLPVAVHHSHVPPHKHESSPLE